MAVPEQTPYIEHIGNGVTTSFALEFQCESKDHLIVLVDEIEPPIATWSLTGGNVVFTTAPASGSKITLQRNTPFSRTTDYQSYNNSFRPPAVNKDFDWIWLKLQELGVADWILSNRIDALKNYVDDRDDELRAYLMEEIRKKGVALDQLDDYYNYLMQRLAQIAVDKGWDASFVVDGDKTQKQINDSIASLYNPLNLNYTQTQLANAFTTSLNALIQKVSLSGGGTISIPDGQFPIDVAVGITLLDDIELRFGKNTILKALAHNSPLHEILRIHDVNNVAISGGGMIDGNKSQNAATTGEWGMGVSIRGADNIHISDLKVENTWGDGFYVGRTNNRAFSSRVTLDRVGSDSSRRNGLSVISVKELDVNDSSFDDSITMEPKCGVDIEPNYADEFIQGVRFKNLKTSGNNIGVNIFLKPLIGTNALVTIDIEGWTDRKSRRENFANRNYLPDSSGYVSINGFTAINEEQSTGSMLALYSIAKTGMAFRLKNIALSSKITNTDNPYVRIGRFDSVATDETMGNIEIDGISARSSNGTLPINAIILNAFPATSRLEGVTIGNIGKLDATNPIRSVSRVSELTIKNENRNFFRSLPAGQSTVSINSLFPLYIRDSSASSSVVIPVDLPSGFEFEIRNAVAGSLDVNVSLITLVSNKLGGTGSLRCSTVGGFIKLKSLGGGVIEYISSYGYTQDGATASTAQATVSVPANSQILLKSINLSGITTSDPVSVSYSAPATGLNIWAACEVNGSVNVYAVNHTATAISLPAGTIKVNRL